MVIHYKCPNCGNDMAYDSESGTLLCEACGTKETIETLPEENITTTFSEEEAREYNCENCGAVLLTDADTVATKCSFCGAGVVLSDRVSGTLAPSLVIPFTISKDEAVQAFKKWCRNGLLTPKGFMSADRVKSITGMYVPFWLYDINSRVKVSGTATKVRTYSHGDYIYTKTKYYDIFRDINLDYLKVPVDASAKMNDELMDKLEPFPYDQLKEFKTPYLAGFIAEKYNYTDQELLPRVNEKIDSFIEDYIRSTVREYQTVNYRYKDIDTKKLKSYYVLLPVWMVVYDYEKSEYTFAMNGNTGKVVGKPPISWGKVASWFGGVSVASLFVFRIITLIMGGGFL
ncbi:TFIIB-type zinc ribbon-containing protein [Pallidibacillus thermolactis]|uniref:TFIIB-type zinc ribbon-containing protein n=1 Tax=Pallidibacillus thermolactis TaxID=251051 RepID=UPI0021D88E1B|nr:TFIIB-type zinc ribbon-containing protein [Pallidibacillus thermolactis]MCU9601537.1 TFIIB-type zinc ribbon-containing protein [Pallidibacillus thermolactis subsp. kokeshiiformis]